MQWVLGRLRERWYVGAVVVRAAVGRSVGWSVVGGLDPAGIVERQVAGPELTGLELTGSDLAGVV